MNKAQRQWKRAIEKALREKGFTRKGAKKTAIMTMHRSIEAKKHDRETFTPSSKNSPSAIAKGKTFAGKIVVIPPS